MRIVILAALVATLAGCGASVKTTAVDERGCRWSLEYMSREQSARAQRITDEQGKQICLGRNTGVEG